jgi:hypothetical protein
VLVWRVCGWNVEGDKFYGDQNLAWAFALPPAEAEEFWSELAELAMASDSWQLADGRDVNPPTVKVGDFASRKTPWASLLQLGPIWRVDTTARSTALVGFLKSAYAQLQEWRRRRQPPGAIAPLIPPSGGNGALLVVVALLLISNRRRRS